MKRETVIYALVDSQQNIGYVGSTTVNAKTRYWEHRSRAKLMHTAPVYAWIRKVGIDSFGFIEIQKVKPNEDAQVVEAQLIKDLIESGHPLQNQRAQDGVPNSNGQRMRNMVSQKAKGRTTWIKGKKGEAAGWTEERRRKVSERYANKKAAQGHNDRET